MKKTTLTLASVTTLFLSSTLWAAAEQYTIIVDAGSTGSRLHLFQYQIDGKVPVIRDIFSESTKPGLSSFADTPSKAGPSLKKLLDDASLELQKNKVDPHTVKVNVLATAGMRLLPEERQEAIYHHVNHFISKHYPMTPGEIKTITGKMEGLYGWLDINYLLRSFDSTRDITRGSIDMGGASTQLVFSTADTSKPEDEFKLSIGDNHYTVFSKSFLGLGLVQAFAEMNTSPLAPSCYPANYRINGTTPGNFSFSTCSSLYFNLINKQQVSQQILPTANMDFIGYSGIYYTYNFFGVESTTNPETVMNQVQSVCTLPWDQLSREHADIPEKFLSSYCANGVYLSNLLYGIYQLQGRNLTVANQIYQQEIDWTLGALLYQLIS